MLLTLVADLCLSPCVMFCPYCSDPHLLRCNERQGLHSRRDGFISFLICLFFFFLLSTDTANQPPQDPGASLCCSISEVFYYCPRLWEQHSLPTVTSSIIERWVRSQKCLPSGLWIIITMHPPGLNGLNARQARA